MARLIAAAVLVGVLWLYFGASGTRVDDSVINVPAGDPEMAAAIEKARKTLPQFWEKHASPKPGEEAFAVKVAIEGGEQVEFFWLSEIQREGRRVSAVINNEPAWVRTVKFGQRIQFDEERISDWTFMGNGKVVGNETMRPLLKRMSSDQAERYRSMYETP